MSSKFDIDSKKIKIVIIISVVMIIFMFIFNIFHKNEKYEIGHNEEAFESEIQDESVFEEDETNATKHEELTRETIFVDIVGEVNSPSMVEVGSKDRLQIAVDKAGGLTEKADRDSINLAQKLTDGAQYVIPKKGEELKINYSDNQKSEGSVKNTVADSEGKVNINTADKDELKTLSGIGDVLAQRIIDYRNENNGFKSVDDINNVKGIGEKKFEEIKSEIFVD